MFVFTSGIELPWGFVLIDFKIIVARKIPRRYLLQQTLPVTRRKLLTFFIVQDISLSIVT